MDNHVVTISREYGSGGRTIGRMFAKAMGWAFYDDEILGLASDESGISINLFGEMDEYIAPVQRLRSGRDAYKGEVYPPSSDEFLSVENRFRYLAKVMRKLAQTENCVIVGRCANYILSDMENAVHLYVHAPLEYCIRKCMEVDALSIDDAEKKITRVDRQRSAYYKHFTGQNWKNADLYDLCINSSVMSWDTSVQVIKGYLESRYESV